MSRHDKITFESCSLGIRSSASCVQSDIVDLSKMATKGSPQPRAKSTRKVARHKVRDSIEQLILEGRIRPGEKLVQLQLARMFDVSLGMIREALFELQGS